MKDFLIIGQGIVGSILAFDLMNRQQTVKVVDNAHQGSSSMVAAGIMSPITGKRFTLTENYDQMFFQAVGFYHQLEHLFGETFFELKPIVRVFQNQEERDHWIKRAEKNSDQHYVDQMNPPNTFSPHIDDPFGSILITSSGFCHTARLLNAFKKYFQEHGVLQQHKFLYEDLKIEKDCIKFCGETYARVIFCEGYQAHHNPWFSWIPFQPVKGEILKITMDDAGLPNAVINKGKWVVPLDGGQWIAGANYDVGQMDCDPTESGKSEIINDLQSTLNRSIEVIQHQAGVRPATTDQRPVAGLHPEMVSLGILNGFGSKGFLMAPSYAVEFAGFLCKAGSIEPTIALERFWNPSFRKNINLL